MSSDNIVDDPVGDENLTPDQIFHGQELERARNRNELLIDCIFCPCIILCSPFLLFCTVFYLPLSILCCFSCIFYVTMFYKPRNAPFTIKLFSLLMRIGFFFFKDFPVRWGQSLTYFLNEIRGFIKSIRRVRSGGNNGYYRKYVEKVEYYDWLRNKNFRCKVYVYEEETKEKFEPQDFYDGEDEDIQLLENKVDSPQPTTPVSPSSILLSVVLIFFHGGGFVIGNPEDHSRFFGGLIKCARDEYRYPIKIYAPDYRCAPRYKVDSILRESVEILKFIVRNNQGSKFVISGDSAGGMLSVLLAHYLRDTKYEIVPKEDIYIIPIYPVLLSLRDVGRFEEEEKEGGDGGSTKSNIMFRSRREFGEWGVIINERPMKKFEELSFENDPFSGEFNNYDFFKNMNDLPPHLIVTAEYDFLRDDGEIYYRKLLLQRSKEQQTNEVSTLSRDMKKKVEEPEISLRRRTSMADLEKMNYSKKKMKSSFDYYQYYCMEKEFHGFTINHFHGREESKEKMISLMVSNIKKRFL